MSVPKARRPSKVKLICLCIIFFITFFGLLIITLIISGLKYWNNAKDDLVKTPRKAVPSKFHTLSIFSLGLLIWRQANRSYGLDSFHIVFLWRTSSPLAETEIRHVSK